MRYHGQYIVMERGQHASDGARRIEVCEAATGAVLATFPAGFNPRWVTSTEMVCESADGTANVEWWAEWRMRYVPANRGQLDANGAGAWAVSDLSNAYVYTASAGDVLVLNAREPRLSVGHLAVRHPVTGALRIHNGAEHGPCEDSRWSSGTLVWWLAGRVWGRTTLGQPTVELTVPGSACGHPVPLWTGSRLFVGLVLDDGELWLCEWSDLAAKNGLGWRVGQSDGSGFDWDMQADGGFLSVCYFDPFGKPVYVDLTPLTVPQQSMLKPKPPADRWELVPDGTLVTGAIETLIGAHPQQDANGIVCLHKNTYPECEWRRVVPFGKTTRALLHWADASRVPGDPGWWIEPAPVWCVDTFGSGVDISSQGQIVDLRPGVPPNRWRQTNTLYGLKHGGILVQFDPRYPHQDYGDGKFYERHFNSPAHGARWELWYTPNTPAARALPWGDRSLDVLKQEVENAPQPPGEPRPFVPCPRPLVTPPVPPPDPKEPEMSLPNDEQMVNAMRRIHVEGYIGELRRAGGIFESPDPARSEIFDPRKEDREQAEEVEIDDFSLSVWTGRYVRYFTEQADDHHERAIRAVLRDLHNSDEARQKRGEQPAPPQTFPGRISVSGDEFQVPS